jgi:nitrogen regulatory protein PII
MGFEPTTTCLGSRCATVALHPQTYSIILHLPRPRKSVIVLSDHNVEKTIDAIRKTAGTGQERDGTILIYPVDDVVRIRTDERGREALHYEGDIDSCS